MKSVVIIAIILITQVFNEVNAQLPVPEGRRLRDIVEDNFPEGNLLIGGTTGAWGLNQNVGKLMDREYSYVTPENDFKHSVVRANPNSWNWSSADAWLQHIINNGQVLRIHAPIAPQCSNWAKEDNRTAAELTEEMDTFMTALCQRYNGVANIKYLDVVNEIALDDGSWFGPRAGTDQWENPWLKIGQDTDPNKTPLYIKRAFEIANEHAPNLKQIINNHCHPGTKGMEKVKQTAVYLMEQGYRVDGIGWQAHVNVGWATKTNLQHLRDLIAWCQERDLEFHVTEFDAFINSTSESYLENQAYTYKAILDVLLEKTDSMTLGWNSWQVTDASGWRTEYSPALFDDSYKAKPAYYAFQLALETKGDYSTRNNITFKVKNSETGEFMEDCQVTFVDSTKFTDIDGESNFQQIKPGRYTLQIKKPLYRTLIKKNVNIFSDTTITLLLNPAIYATTFHLQNQYSGENIPSVSVTYDSITIQTSIDGNVNFDFRPGTYNLSFEKTGYQSFESDFTIMSDTILNIPLQQTLAYVKFRIKNSNNQPVNNVQVILDEDTLFTSSLGIVTFESLNVDSSYSFDLSKDKYKSQQGSLILHADTTINIQLQKSLVIVQFQLIPEISNPENGFVVLNNDTSYFNTEGLTKFYDIPVDNEYQYRIYNDDYSDILDTVFVTNDTTINITALVSSINGNDISGVKIFPNPVQQTLFIKSNSIIEKYSVYSIIGEKIIEQRISAFNASENLSGLTNGIYFMDILFENGEKQIIRFIKTEQ